MTFALWLIVGFTLLGCVLVSIAMHTGVALLFVSGGFWWGVSAAAVVQVGRNRWWTIEGL